MKTLKIVLGIILGIASVVTLSQLSGGEAQGAGLAGSLTGFALMAGLAGWLIYSGCKSTPKKD